MAANIPIPIKEESDEEECYEVVEVIDDPPEAETNGSNAQAEKMDVDDDSKAPELQATQLQLSARKKEMVKIKSRIRSCLAKLRQQDELIEGLQEQLAKNKFSSIDDDDKGKRFDWTGIKAAHLISKVFEHCDPVTKSDSPNDQEDGKEKTKCHYTTDFHRFATTLYFFSPKAYFYLNMIAPLFPDRNYIRQWVTSGHVEKLFPKGVWRDEFND